MQLELPMANLPRPTAGVWATLTEVQRDEALDLLARVIARAAHVQLPQEDVHHERCEGRVVLSICAAAPASIFDSRPARRSSTIASRRGANMPLLTGPRPSGGRPTRCRWSMRISGATAERRAGCARLTADVALGHVGIVLDLEVSRVARNNADWYRLLDLCGHHRHPDRRCRRHLSSQSVQRPARSRPQRGDV